MPRNTIPLVVATTLVALDLTACGASSAPTTQPAAAPVPTSAAMSSSTSTSKAPASSSKGTATTSDATAAALAKFEKDNAIPTSSWFPHVTSKEVKFSNSLWVYTDLPATGAAPKDTASRMCGSYAQFVLVQPSVTTTFIRASDGQQLAKCGPAASQ